MWDKVFSLANQLLYIKKIYCYLVGTPIFNKLITQLNSKTFSFKQSFWSNLIRFRSFSVNMPNTIIINRKFLQEVYSRPVIFREILLHRRDLPGGYCPGSYCLGYFVRGAYFSLTCAIMSVYTIFQDINCGWSKRIIVLSFLFLLRI